MNERGQSLPILAGLFVLALAIFSLVTDAIILYADDQEAQANLDVACLAAADGSSFQGSLDANGVRADWERSIVAAPESTLLADLQGPHDFYLAQFMNIRYMDVHVQSRCTGPRAAVLPICVKEPDVLNGIGSGAEYPILGQGVEATDARGSSFSGACVTQIWCSNTDCEPKTFYEPTSDARSPNQFKDVWADTVIGLAGSPLVPIGGRLPVLDGVSNHFEAQTVQDNFSVGDQIVLMVYSGIINTPEPSYGNWENVQVLFYVRAEITAMDANTVYARFIERIDNLTTVETLKQSVTVPLDWGGWIDD